MLPSIRLLQRGLAQQQQSHAARAAASSLRSLKAAARSSEPTRMSCCEYGTSDCCRATFSTAAALVAQLDAAAAASITGTAQAHVTMERAVEETGAGDGYAQPDSFAASKSAASPVPVRLFKFPFDPSRPG